MSGIRRCGGAENPKLCDHVDLTSLKLGPRSFRQVSWLMRRASPIRQQSMLLYHSDQSNPLTKFTDFHHRFG